jgi:peptide/nickel transport system ATP-binding protein
VQHDAEKLETIPGRVPSLVGELKGCGFRNRCRSVTPACAIGEIDVRRVSDGHGYRCLFDDVADGSSQVEGKR